MKTLQRLQGWMCVGVPDLDSHHLDIFLPVTVNTIAFVCVHLCKRHIFETEHF